MRDVFQGQTDAMKAKTKTTIVAMDRAMLEMVRELRLERRRPLARSAEEAAPYKSEPTEASPAAAVVTKATILDMPANMDVPATEQVEDAPEVPVMASPQPDAAAPTNTANATAVGPRLVREAEGRLEDTTTADARAAASALLRDAADSMQQSGSLSTDESALKDRVAAFEAAFAATIETLAEARAFEHTATAAKALTGD